MTRDEYETLLTTLGESTNIHTEIPHQVEVITETAKAIRIRIPSGVVTEAFVWLPKSQCASKSHQHLGRSLCVRRSWIINNRLWWMVH